MSDERLRTLEARWKQSGLLEDEAALLLERSRCGELPVDRLELAAALGDSASRLALNETASFQPPERAAFLGWVCRLEPAIRIRVVLASARSLLARPPSSPEPGFELGSPAPHEALKSLEAWCVCPCADHLGQALAHDGLPAKIPAGFSDSEWFQGATALHHLIAFLRQGDEKTLDLALIRASHTNPLPAVQADLIPWALGRSDPLSESSG